MTVHYHLLQMSRCHHGKTAPERCDECKAEWDRAAAVAPPHKGWDGDKAAGFPEIVAVAVMFNDEIWTLPKPARHHHVLNAISGVHGMEACAKGCGPGSQGFLTSWGRFMGREQAANTVKASGQLKRNLHAPPLLYSEDLW